MGQDIFETTINLIKLVLIFLAMIQVVPLLVWVERRGSAFIQNRFGPNRVGPFGLTQLLADAVKFIFKEEFFPSKSVRVIYYMAPVAALIPAALALAALPLSTPIQVGAFEWLGKSWGPYTFEMQSFHIPVGVVYVLAASSLGVYALLLAGWGSSNKYSLMGALRASAQMMSYELALGLSIVGTILVFGSLDFQTIIQAQEGFMHFHFFGSEYQFFLPNWGIFYQPLAAIVFIVAVFAESNRLPFDLPEAEGELVAGFHTEYGGFKLLLFFMGEYGHMIVASGLFAIFYLGGYGLPWVDSVTLTEFFSGIFHHGTMSSIVTSLVYLVIFLFKIALFIWLFMWVRWSLPRFKYDRLMELGWKTLMPLALVNIILTASIMFVARYINCGA